MRIATKLLHFASEGHTDIQNLTEEVAEALRATGLRDGVVTVFADPGSTAAISTMEFEPGLVQDMKDVLEKLAPYKKDYHHHKTWGDFNGSSHVRSTLMGPSLSVPFSQGQLNLGTWQQIVFFDFDDRAQRRTVVCKFIGE